MSESRDPSLEDRGQFQERNGRINSINNARAEMNADLSERPSESDRTAESVGAERLDRATEWVSDKYDGAKAVMGRASSFLKRLGLGVLGADQAVKNIGADVAEKGREMYAGAKEAVVREATEVASVGREAYTHVSEAVRGQAQKAGEKINGAWNHAVEVRDRVVDSGREKVNAIAERGRSFRDGVIGKIHDVALAAKLKVIESNLARASQENEKSERIAERIRERVTANNQTIEDLRQQINEISAKRGESESLAVA